MMKNRTEIDHNNLNKTLLHFIYWDKLPDMEEEFAGVGLSRQWASTLMAQHLLAAADQYGIERLRFLCETKLCEDVTINTVATTLALAEQHHCIQLKSVCLKFVSEPENLNSIKLETMTSYLIPLVVTCYCLRLFFYFFLFFPHGDAKRWV